MKFYGIKDYNIKGGKEIVTVIQTVDHVSARWFYVNKLKDGETFIVDISSHELNGMQATNLLHSGIDFHTFEGETEYLKIEEVAK
ncbi:hypothetical protein [Bacillus thuringiensis]|uniref:hypothetical protein n=1 Tax=Bacillus thuringiensis TaxID=1428 RepID=UPI000BF56B9D|nr:hypothetical protein [Bacillus thuringiensis]PET15062.1 hypothetical protein CN517_26185 [Bacillus thuringiensis]